MGVAPLPLSPETRHQGCLDAPSPPNVGALAGDLGHERRRILAVWHAQEQCQGLGLELDAQVVRLRGRGEDAHLFRFAADFHGEGQDLLDVVQGVDACFVA